MLSSPLDGHQNCGSMGPIEQKHRGCSPANRFGDHEHRCDNTQLAKTLPNGGLKATLCPDARKSDSIYSIRISYRPLDHDVAQAVVAEPAYWSFAGPVARRWHPYILANPSLVAGKTVLDFGAGSGVVAVACLGGC